MNILLPWIKLDSVSGYHSIRYLYNSNNCKFAHFWRRALPGAKPEWQILCNLNCFRFDEVIAGEIIYLDIKKYVDSLLIKRGYKLLNENDKLLSLL